MEECINLFSSFKEVIWRKTSKKKFVACQIFAVLRCSFGINQQTCIQFFLLTNYVIACVVLEKMSEKLRCRTGIEQSYVVIYYYNTVHFCNCTLRMQFNVVWGTFLRIYIITVIKKWHGQYNTKNENIE